MKPCTVFHQQFKRFSDECQLRVAHSVFSKGVQNVHQLQK